MAVAIHHADKLRSAAQFLREAGRQDEATAVEAMLPAARRRLPTKPPAGELIPIREAAERLGLSRNAVQRRIDLEMLDAVKDPDNGYRYVTQASVKENLRNAEIMRSLAEPLFEDDEPIPRDSILGQMLLAAERLDAEE